MELWREYYTEIMYKRVHYFGSIIILFSLIYVVKNVFTEMFEDDTLHVEEWLDQNDLGEYKKLFREYGTYIRSLSTWKIFVFSLYFC